MGSEPLFFRVDPRPKHTLSHLSIFGEQIQPRVRLLFSDLRKSHGEQKND